MPIYKLQNISIIYLINHTSRCLYFNILTIRYRCLFLNLRLITPFIYRLQFLPRANNTQVNKIGLIEVQNIQI